MLVCLIALVTFRRSRVGSNDDAFDDDPEDPDYVEEPVEEFEGKSYCPLLDHVEPSLRKYKIGPMFKLNLFYMHEVSI